MTQKEVSHKKAAVLGLQHLLAMYSGAVAVSWYAMSIALLCVSLQPVTRNTANTSNMIRLLLFMSLEFGQRYAKIVNAANKGYLFL